LSEELQSITGINPLVLNHGKSLTSITVAEKMSWAASRETTRIEDTAYCLLGIFNVNIPLLYGEEEKAFRRLQEEIIRTTPDRSIFAWRLPKSPAMGSYPGMTLPVRSNGMSQSVRAALDIVSLFNTLKSNRRELTDHEF